MPGAFVTSFKSNLKGIPTQHGVYSDLDVFPGGGGGGGGGHSCTAGGRTFVTYFAEEGVFLRPPHVRDLVKEGTFSYPGTKYGGENPLTIHEISAAVTPSGSRSDWASEFAAAEDYNI